MHSSLHTVLTPSVGNITFYLLYLLPVSVRQSLSEKRDHTHSGVLAQIRCTVNQIKGQFEMKLLNKTMAFYLPLEWVRTELILINVFR